MLLLFALLAFVVYQLKIGPGLDMITTRVWTWRYPVWDVKDGKMLISGLCYMMHNSEMFQELPMRKSVGDHDTVAENFRVWDQRRLWILMGRGSEAELERCMLLWA